MLTRKRSGVPGTPRVISPSPTNDNDAQPDAYLGPTTRSAARKRRTATDILDEDDDVPDSPDLRRSRTRSRSPMDGKVTKLTASRLGKASQTANGHGQIGGLAKSGASPSAEAPAKAPAKAPAEAPAATENGHLSPLAAKFTGWSWRDFSRSPSPLGLIPIHRHWRTFVHKHEVPRKALHVSIGFFVVWLYLSGTQTRSTGPYLLGALIPIAAADVLRHHHAPFNRFYVKVLGALMRESEFMSYNGVIFYLLGAWIVLNFFPKDIGVMGTLLLSWCDTAASTFGRLYGRYTPRIRRGKSMAGSLAACLVGVGTAAAFWGWLVPAFGPMPGDEEFMFTGSLHLPRLMADALGLNEAQVTVSGALAVGILSVWSGLVAATSEVVDLFGWDDNLTIPVLSGIGIWGFLRVFG